MTEEEQIARLNEAQKLPVATVEDMRYVPKGISEEQLKMYLNDFAKPTGKCWLCEEELYVEWGLVHGISHCTTCGMDVREYHYLKDENGKEQRITRSLQNHPKHYSYEEETNYDRN